MQYKGHFAVQGHSRSPMLVPIESAFLLVIDNNVPPISLRTCIQIRPTNYDYWKFKRPCETV